MLVKTVLLDSGRISAPTSVALHFFGSITNRVHLIFRPFRVWRVLLVKTVLHIPASTSVALQIIQYYNLSRTNSVYLTFLDKAILPIFHTNFPSQGYPLHISIFRDMTLRSLTEYPRSRFAILDALPDVAISSKHKISIF